MANLLNFEIHAFDIQNQFKTSDEFKIDFISKIVSSLERGAQVLLFPEYCFYAAANIPSLRKTENLAKFVWTEIFPQIMSLSTKYDALICAGTAPNYHRDTGKLRNRCLIAASGKSIESYKRCLAPWENDFEAGSQTCMFEWKNLKFANLICDDVEFPEIAGELKRFQPHFILVPSSSADEISMERISRCASARAVELGAIVFVSPLVGNDENNPFITENIGRCSIYFPSQLIFKNQHTMQSPVYKNGYFQMKCDIDLELVSKIKKMDSETKPYLISMNTF